MVFLGNLKKINDQKYEVQFKHYMPMHPTYGLGKTEEQLEQEGVLIDTLLRPEEIEGKIPKLYWNPVNQETFYEYENIPNSKEENLEEKVQVLTENLAQEKINNMKKDALAVNLTKEVANLKIEVMNLKKGGNQ